jgi:hypothetical protein
MKKSSDRPAMKMVSYQWLRLEKDAVHTFAGLVAVILIDLR